MKLQFVAQFRAGEPSVREPREDTELNGREQDLGCRERKRGLKDTVGRQLLMIHLLNDASLFHPCEGFPPKLPSLPRRNQAGGIVTTVLPCARDAGNFAHHPRWTLRARRRSLSLAYQAHTMKARLLLLAITVLLSMDSSAKAQNPDLRGAASLGPEAIFQLTNIWAVHLSFTPDQWDAMEPTQSPGGLGGTQRRTFLQGPEGGRNGIAAAFGFVFKYVHADLEFGSHVFRNVAVRYKGNGTFLSSRTGPKRSLKIDLNQFVKEQKLGGMSQLNLHNSVRDSSGMNEAMAYQLFRDGGLPAPRTAFARVYITVPGKHNRQYFGLYNLVEDVSSSFAEDRFNQKGGALFKPVTPHLFSDLGDAWADYNQTYDPKGNLSEQQKSRVIEFSRFASSASDEQFASQLGRFVDVAQFARYMAITVWLTDLDGILGPGQNYYLYLHPSTQKFMFIPWDQDQPFGQFPRGTQEQREQLSIRRPWTGENKFLERAFKNEEFYSAYVAALREYSASLFQPERLDKKVSELAKAIRPAIKEESSERLEEFEKAVAGKNVATSMGPRFGSFEVKSLRGFVRARNASVADQLAGRSEGMTISQGLGGR